MNDKPPNLPFEVGTLTSYDMQTTYSGHCSCQGTEHPVPSTPYSVQIRESLIYACTYYIVYNQGLEEYVSPPNPLIISLKVPVRG